MQFPFIVTDSETQKTKTMSITYSITGTSEKVTFNAEGFYNNPTLFDISSTSVTSETITSSGGTANSITLSDTGGAVTALLINGDTSFNASGMIASFVSHLNSISASTDTGGVFIDTSLGTLKSAFTFTGGSGTDWLMMNTASLDALKAGTQLNGGTATSGNVLGIIDVGTFTGTSASTGEYKSLNATKGFQILGVGGTGNTAVINDAFLTNGFATHILDGQNGGSLTVTNVGKTFTLDISDAYIDNPTPTNFTIGSAASTTTALTVNLSPHSTSPTLLAGLTEGTLTTTGGTITSVALVSNTATSANTITTYHGSDSQTLTITGNDALTIKGVTPNATKGDTINASTFTQALTLGTIGVANAVATRAGDTGKGDVIKLGVGTSSLAVSSVAIGDKITLLPGHTAVDTLDTTLIASAIAAMPYSSAAAQQADITQITNFNTRSDILKVGIGGVTLPLNGISTDLTGHAWTVTNGVVTGTGLTGATGLSAFLADVASTKTFAANDVLAFTDGTNTYIATGDHAAGTALGENIIELVGVHTATSLGNNGGTSTIDIAGLTTNLQATLTLNSVGSPGNPVTQDVKSPLVTSETVISIGSTTNYVTLTNTGGAVTALTINGNAALNVSIDGSFVPRLNTINASADTGSVNIDLSDGTLKPTFTFTGGTTGTGTNWLTINTPSLDALNSGSQLNGGKSISGGNVLAINDMGQLNVNEYVTLNATTGFQILAIGDQRGYIFGSHPVINDSYLTNGFATHMIVNQNNWFGSSLTVTNLGSTFTLDVVGHQGITLGSAAYADTALTVNIIPGLQSPTPVVGLTIPLTTRGDITSVTFVSNTATSANIINTYQGLDGQTVTITGNNDFTIGSITHNASIGDTIDASSFTKIMTLGSLGGGIYTVATGAGDTGKGDIIKLGSGPSYLAVSSAVIGDHITLLPGRTAFDTIDTTLITSAIAATPYSSAAAQQADITQIANFDTIHDFLQVGIGSLTRPSNGTSADLTGHSWTVTNGFVTGAGLTGATGLKAFLADVASSTTFTAHEVLAYTDGSNTYIAVGDHAPGIALGENIIELVGVHTATSLGGTGGATTIHIFS